VERPVWLVGFDNEPASVRKLNAGNAADA